VVAPKVAILGCGPAGLVAAHAATLTGADVQIFSRKQKSQLYGAQYLHAPIPFVTPVLDCKIVNYTLNGTPEEYRRKVYGDADVEVSPVKLLGPQKAWDIRDTYEHLWALYHDLVTPMADIKYHEVQEIMAREDWARVYSSIPAPAICAAPSWHHFESARIWAVGAVETGAFEPREMEDASAIVCDGTSERRWYRSSNVFGFTCISSSDHVISERCAPARDQASIESLQKHLLSRKNSKHCLTCVGFGSDLDQNLEHILTR